MQKNMENFVDVFVEVIQALSKLCKNKDDEIALNSIENLKKSIDFLVQKTESVKKSEETIQNESQKKLINNESQKILDCNPFSYKLINLKNYNSFLFFYKKME